MPKTWLYYIALVTPLVLRVLIFDTGFLDWLWYCHYADAYYLLNRLSVQPLFVSFVGGWALPVFIFTIAAYWQMQENDDGIPEQFLLLPFIYLPFTIACDLLMTGEWHSSNLYTHPLIVIPAGYLYVFTWVTFIWVMDKFRLVL